MKNSHAQLAREITEVSAEFTAGMARLATSSNASWGRIGEKDLFAALQFPDAFTQRSMHLADALVAPTGPDERPVLDSLIAAQLHRLVADTRTILKPLHGTQAHHVENSIVTRLVQIRTRMSAHETAPSPSDATPAVQSLRRNYTTEAEHQVHAAVFGTKSS